MFIVTVDATTLWPCEQPIPFGDESGGTSEWPLWHRICTMAGAVLCGP